MEVLVSVAIAGMVISAGFRLIAMSMKLMIELQTERNLISAAQKIWLRFRTENDMPDNGTDDDDDIHWESQNQSIQIDEYELTYRRVKITVGNSSTFIYVGD